MSGLHQDGRVWTTDGPANSALSITGEEETAAAMMARSAAASGSGGVNADVSPAAEEEKPWFTQSGLRDADRQTADPGSETNPIVTDAPHKRHVLADMQGMMGNASLLRELNKSGWFTPAWSDIRLLLAGRREVSVNPRP